MKYALFLPFFFLFSSAFTQSFDYVPANIYFTNGDSLSAKVLEDNAKGYLKNVSVIDNGQLKKYQAKDISRIQFEDYQVIQNPFDEFALIVPLNSGQLELYEAQQESLEYFVIAKDTNYYLLEKVVGNTGRDSYRQVLHQLSKDQIGIFNQISQLSYEDESLLEFVHSYNTSKGIPGEVFNRKKRTMLNFQIGSTLNKNTYIFYSNHTTSIQRGNYFSVYLEKYLKRNISFTYGLNHIQIRGDMQFDDTDINFSYLQKSTINFIGVPIGFSFFPLERQTKIALDLILTTQFIFSQEMVQYRPFFEQSKEIEYVNDNVNLHLQFGPSFYFKDFGLSTKAYLGYAVQDHIQVISSYGLIVSLNYRFRIDHLFSKTS